MILGVHVGLGKYGSKACVVLRVGTKDHYDVDRKMERQERVFQCTRKATKAVKGFWVCVEALQWGLREHSWHESRPTLEVWVEWALCSTGEGHSCANVSTW